MSYLIKNGRVIDPRSGIDGVCDILVSQDKIVQVGKELGAKTGDELIDAKGKIVVPGLIDMHTHLREPGREDKETILTGTRAALRGGFTTVACMPNTEPALDDKNAVESLNAIITRDAFSHVSVIGAITKGRAGKTLNDFGALKKAGVVALSDDGYSVDDEEVMRAALVEAKKVSLPLIAHCEETQSSRNGVMNQGYMSTKMGLCGMPRSAEYRRVERDIELAKKAGARIHIAHLSCRESVDIVRRAKRAGVEVSAETCPHYFTLTDSCCGTFDTNTKMNPPLREPEDVQALKEGIADGTIDVIATDHAPHTDAEKDVEFDFAPFGIIGLETALSLAVMELVSKNVISWSELILKMSANPAELLGLSGGTLKKGAVADITIIDPEKEYLFTKNSIESKSRNTPFIDWKLRAMCVTVFVAGRLALRNGVVAERDEAHT